MEIFEEHYFNLNRRLLAFIGMWPYEADTRRRRAIFMFVEFSLTMPQLIGAILHRDDVDRMMLCSLFFIIGSLTFLKMVALTLSEDKMKALYEIIAQNWSTIRDVEEQGILANYAERARVMTKIYSLLVILAITACLVPLVPKILDVVSPRLDEPRSNLYVTEGEYFLDPDIYFKVVMIFDTIFMMTTIFITVAVDTVYIASSEHGCAMSAIISYRLRNLGPSEDPPMSEDDLYGQIVRIIELHQESFSYTALINEAYALNFFYIFFVNMICTPLCVCAILANLNNPVGLIPYVILFIGVAVHLFVTFFPGQRVLDHNLWNDTYCNEWYALPLHTQKLLLIIMMRCRQPATLTAAGLFTIDFQSFAFVIRTAVSYITVLASFRY